MRNYKTSPWGQVQYQENFEGVCFVSTASHGGFKVMPSQNKLIPESFRNNDGWYEEDCEQAIVVFFLTPVLNDDKNDPVKFDEAKQRARRSLQNYYWKEFEEYFAVELTPEESYSKKEFLRSQGLVNKLAVISRSKGQAAGTLTVWLKLGGRENPNQTDRTVTYKCEVPEDIGRKEYLELEELLIYCIAIEHSYFELVTHSPKTGRKLKRGYYQSKCETVWKDILKEAV